MGKMTIYLVMDDGGYATASTRLQAAALVAGGFRIVERTEYLNVQKKARELDAQAAAQDWLAQCRDAEFGPGTRTFEDEFKE